MIARIRGYQGMVEFVALRHEPQSDAWVPIRGDHGRHGEMYERMAIDLCVAHLQRQLAPALEDAGKLHKLCTRRGDESELDRKRQMHALSESVSTALDLAGVNLSRLLDAPTANDGVLIEAEHETDEPMTSDRLFLRYVSAAFGYAHRATGQPVSDAGIEDVIGVLRRVLDDRRNPSNGNNVSGTGGEENNGGDDA